VNAQDFQELFKNVRTPGRPAYRGGPTPGNASRHDAVVGWVLWELGIYLDDRCQVAGTRPVSVAFTAARRWRTGYVLDITFTHAAGPRRSLVEQLRVYIMGVGGQPPVYQIELVEPGSAGQYQWSATGFADLRGGMSWYVGNQ